MPAITSKVDHMLNGVSQRPPDQRSPHHWDILENALVNVEFGVRKRPPSATLGQISATTTGYSTAFVHQINRSPTERYVVVIANGDLKVYDAFTGTEQLVTFPNGKAYLGGGATKGFRAFTVGDHTFIVDRDKTVVRGAKISDTLVNEALIFVRQGDYSTTYKVTIDNEIAQVQTPSEAAATSRDAISTDQISNDLFTALSVNSEKLKNEFTFTLMGSTVHLKRNDGGDFQISSQDGLADKGLRTIKGKVEAFEDLPAKARVGMIVKIESSPATQKDDTWVKYETGENNEGIWRECVAPNLNVNLDTTSMPQELVRKGNLTPLKAAMDLPRQPTSLAKTGTVWLNGWTTDGADVALSGTEAYAKEVVVDGGAVRSPALNGTNATANRDVKIVFDLDTSNAYSGTTAEVQLSFYNGTVWSVLQTKQFNSGLIKRNQSFAFRQILPVGARFELKLNIKTIFGRAPTNSRSVILTAHGNADPIPGITITQLPSMQIFTGTSTMVWPKGMAWAITLDGFAYSGTLADDKTTTQLNTILQTAINGTNGFTATYTPPAGGFQVFQSLDGFTVTNSASNAPVVNSMSFTLDTVHIFFNNTLTMTPAAFVGRTVLDQSSGATGVITDNSATTIKVNAGLSGFNWTNFQVGDVCAVLGTGLALFVFQNAPWGERVVGDNTTAPFPSFTDRAVSDVSFYAGRLVFTAEDFVLLSDASDVYSFFRKTTTAVLDDDPIDLQNAHKDVALFDSALPWDNGLLLCSGSGHQFKLTAGDQLLTPATARIEHIASYQVTPNCRPLVLGTSLMLPRKFSGYTQLRELYREQQSLKSELLTEHVPTYIPGDAKYICGDSDLGFFAMLTDTAATQELYVLNWGTIGDQQYKAWHKWTFGGQVIHISYADGYLYLVLFRSGAVKLERINVGAPKDSSDHRDIGSVAYTFKGRLSRHYIRDRNGVPLTHGRVQLRTLEVKHHDSGYYRVEVTNSRVGETLKSYVVQTTEGKKRIPILTQNNAVTIDIINDNQAASSISGVEWEATYSDRSQRA